MPSIAQRQIHVSKKKALLIGVRYSALHKKYPDEKPPFLINGTHGDPSVIARLLTNSYGYDEKDIVILMDDGKHILPTRGNIIDEMYKLVEDAQAGDHFVFHFSGHGSQVRNWDGKEDDGYDEVIWPLDVEYDPETEEQNGYIIDDDLKKILVDNLPADARITCLLDCCHSGTGLDLPNNHSDSSLDSQWSPVQEVASHGPEYFDSPGMNDQSSPKEAPERSMSIETVMASSRSSTLNNKDIKMKRNVKGVGRSMKMPYKARGAVISLKANGEPSVSGENVVLDEQRPPKEGKKGLAHATSWSACLDDQLGIDTDNGGVLTSAFSKILSKNQRLTNRQMIAELNKELFYIGKEAKRFMLKNYDTKLPQPKPCLGSLRPLVAILDEDFTF